MEELNSGEFQLLKCSEFQIYQKEEYFEFGICKPCCFSCVQNI